MWRPPAEQCTRLKAVLRHGVGEQTLIGVRFLLQMPLFPNLRRSAPMVPGTKLPLPPRLPRPRRPRFNRTPMMTLGASGASATFLLRPPYRLLQLLRRRLPPRLGTRRQAQPPSFAPKPAIPAAAPPAVPLPASSSSPSAPRPAASPSLPGPSGLHAIHATGAYKRIGRLNQEAWPRGSGRPRHQWPPFHVCRVPARFHRPRWASRPSQWPSPPKLWRLQRPKSLPQKIRPLLLWQPSARLRSSLTLPCLSRCLALPRSRDIAGPRDKMPPFVAFTFLYMFSVPIHVFVVRRRLPR